MTKLPLEGIRVIDHTVVYAGPYASLILADMGAEVIRVESLQHFPPTTRGTYARPTKEMVARMGPQAGYPNGEPGERPWNRFATFNSMNRNKLSMTFDLTRPEGKEIYKRLVRVSDVVLENSVPGVMEKLGITYEMLRKEKPDIIYARSSGYGLTGPYSKYRAFGGPQDHFVAHASLRGYRDGDSTTVGSTVAVDNAAGSQVAFSIVAALHYRNRTGKGQLLSLSMSENFLTYIPQAFMDYSMNGRVQKTLGNRDPSAAPCGNFRCKGANKWVSITVYNDEDWEGFQRAVGEKWVHDERFRNALSRWNHQDELEPLVEAWTKRHEDYEVMHLLQKEGVAAGPLLDEAAAYRDPHLIERGFFVEESQEDVGTHLYPGFTFKMEKTPPRVRRGPVRLGENNDYLYREVLGLSEEEYDHLKAQGHIGMDYTPDIK